MIDEGTIKQAVALFFIVVLLIFAFFIIKPIFMAALFGLILAYTFSPINELILSKVKNKTISAAITCTIVIGIIALVTWFTLPLLLNQIFDAYIALQSFDLVGFLKNYFPFLFTSQQVTNNFAVAYNNFVVNAAKVGLEKFSESIVNLPTIILKMFVVLIVFFYSLRDGEKLVNLLKDSLPFNKSTTNRFIQKSKQVTFGVVYGRVIIGIIVGMLAGIGFYFAGVSNALLLMILTMIVSIMPLIGPWLVWVPVVVGLFLTGSTGAAIFLLIYSVIVVALFENIATPLLLSKQSDLPTSLTLIGLIGGMLMFGIFGIIIGPLVIAYLIILFELYVESNVKKSS